AWGIEELRPETGHDSRPAVGGSASAYGRYRRHERQSCICEWQAVGCRRVLVPLRNGANCWDPANPADAEPAGSERYWASSTAASILRRFSGGISNGFCL